MADHDRNYAQVQTGARTGTEAIDAGLRSYMMSVYNLMALGVAVTAIITLFMANNPALMQTVALGPMKWVLFAGVLGMGFFAPKLIFSGSKAMAHLAFWAYAGMWGLLISPMVAFYLAKDPGIVVQALGITSVTFGATSLYGYVTKRDLSPFRTFFVMATIGLLVAMLVNVFLQSTLFSLITSFGVVLVFAGVTAWETQAIKEMYHAGDDEATARSKGIFGAFILYGSFITMFIHILNILGIMRGD
ncbi:MAG: Bax inhibitor-1/YccA family protein [Alphaproteobacteria bacterium]|nr:Bax inhibitor-1/YccA family protein [Alphaproteobacteria bacterium]